MLDFYYPSLWAFVRACRNARAYVAQNPDLLHGDASAYDARKILQTRSMVILTTGEVIAPSFIF